MNARSWDAAFSSPQKACFLLSVVFTKLGSPNYQENKSVLSGGRAFCISPRVCSVDTDLLLDLLFGLLFFIQLPKLAPQNVEVLFVSPVAGVALARRRYNMVNHC